MTFRVTCCGRLRGVVDTEGGQWLFCSRCDFVHDYAAGPPIDRVVRDLSQDPRPIIRRRTEGGS